ncbi:MAG: lipid-A-disaccharide synthase [Calditrichaeota bacterium]|nr:lipid-A-disaccharide synthase [Calditrichota bacterium]
MQSEKILLIAGEVSGDAHAAELVRAIHAEKPATKFYGIGGDELKALGMEIFFHISEMAFLGIGEIIKHLPFIFRVKKTLMDWAKKEKPDCVILVDYPGFNLRIAKSLHEIGVPVVYYISPQLWAWGQKRVEIIRRNIDRMIVLFPFEEKFYSENGIKATYVGHPLVDKHSKYLPDKPRKINKGNVTLGLLPGSRKQEVTTLLPKMIETAVRLYHDNLVDHVEIVRVEHMPEEFYINLVAAAPKIFTIVCKPLRECLPKYDAVMVASGTATLECGYYAVPMLIVYHVNPLTYFLGKRLVKVKNIGLVNIVAEKQVAVELIQHDFTVDKAFSVMKQILDPENNLQLRTDLSIIKDKLGDPGASSRAANVVTDLLNDEKHD